MGGEKYSDVHEKQFASKDEGEATSELFDAFVHGRSFKELATIPTAESITPLVGTYEHMVTNLFNTLEQIRTSVAVGEERFTEEDLATAEDLVFSGLFGSSEAPEVRLLFLGLKPAVQSNVGGEFRENIRAAAPNINIEDFYSLALVRGVGDIQIDSVNYGSAEEPRIYDIAYSPKLIKEVMTEYKELFLAYGYDDQSDETITRAVKDNHSLIRSLLLGFPLKSAISHDADPENLLRLPLTDDQKRSLEERRTLQEVDKDFSHMYNKGDQNQHLQGLWSESGLDAFLDKTAEKCADTLGIDLDAVRTDWL